MAADRVTLQFKGGDKMNRILKRMNTGLNTAKGVSVGFIDHEHYPSTHGIRGTPRSPVAIAMNAFWQNYGTKRIPARPFFTDMIEKNSPSWGDSLAHLAKVYNYDGRKMLTSMGIGIASQLVGSIRDWSNPPNAPATEHIKGFNNPLVDEGIMQRNVSYEVTTKL